MAITYPREMLCGVQTLDFELMRSLNRNMLAGGLTQVRQSGEDRWRANFTYAPRSPLDYGALQAWLDSLRGGLRDFLGHDALKPFPDAYRGGPAVSRAGGGAFDWTASVGARTADSLTVTNLPAAFQLRAGDMVGLVESGRHGLFRIMETVTANGSGQVALTVEPRIITTLFTLGATVTFKRPACLMTLDPSSISTTRTAGTRPPVTFSGIQKVF